MDIKKRDILTNNSKAKSLPTVKEREAFADGLLEEVYQELLTLENDHNEHKSLLDSKSKNTMDKSVNTIKQKEPYLDSIADLKHVSSECELYHID